MSTGHLILRGHLYTCSHSAPTGSVLLAWSLHPGRGLTHLMCASPVVGSPPRVWGENECGGWAGVGTRSGAGGAALCAEGPSRLPGLYCRGGEACQHLDSRPWRIPSTLPPFLGTTLPRNPHPPSIPILSPPLAIPRTLPQGLTAPSPGAPLQTL